MDPMTLAILATFAQGIGGAVSGGQQAAATGADRAEQAREFDINRSDRLDKRNETAGIRDRLNYYFQQRMGLPQQRFAPHSISNPQATQWGGVDPNAMNAAIGKYTPGAGGVKGVGGNPANPNYAPPEVPGTRTGQSPKDQAILRAQATGHKGPFSQKLVGMNHVVVVDGEGNVIFDPKQQNSVTHSGNSTTAVVGPR